MSGFSDEKIGGVTTCRRCGKPIRFVETENGKKVPVDAAGSCIYETKPANTYYTKSGRRTQGCIVHDDYIRHVHKKEPEEMLISAWRLHFETCVPKPRRRKA